jgi:hypothetical protein
MVEQSIAKFNGQTLAIIDHDGHKWLTAREVGVALGYKIEEAANAVNRLYARHADEFGIEDTCTVKLTVQGQAREVRVFSATGCNTLGFFSGTKVAKEFRSWAKKVLAGQPPVASVAPVDARLDRMDQALTQLAESMNVLMTANNTTQKYIAVLEHNQRGMAFLTYEKALEGMRLAAGGYSQAQAARLLRLSPTTFNQMVRGKYPFSPTMAKPEGYDEEAKSLREQIDEIKLLRYPHMAKTG